MQRKYLIHNYLYNKYLLLIYTILSLCICCTDKTVDIKILMTVKDNNGNPIEGALVKIENNEIGHTNSKGILETKIKTKLNIKNRVEITKQSEDFYFSPSYDSFIIKDPNSEPIKIDAIMYFVPKNISKQTSKTYTEKESENIITSETQNKLPNNQNDSTIVQQTPPAESTSKQPADLNSNVQEQSSTLSDNTQKIQETSIDTTNNKHSKDLSLNPIIHPQQSQKPLDYPSKKYENEGINVFYIRTYADQNTPLNNVTIHIGEEESEGLKLLCKTSQNGRCNFRYNETDENKSIIIIAAKPGYQTSYQKIPLNNLKSATLLLKKGSSIDIYALTKNYNYTRGVEGIDVLIKGKKEGTTDKFGFFTFAYNGKKNDLIDIQLESSNYLPEEYTTDFIVSQSNFNLVKYYMPKDPPKVKIVLLSPQSAGDNQLDPSLLKPYGKLDKILRQLTNKYIFSLNSFSLIDLNFFMSKVKENKLKSFLKKGWYNSNLKAHVDAILLPTIISGNKSLLELSVIDSKGHTLAAATEYFKDVDDIASFDQSIKSIAQKLINIFPFEGTIIDKDKEKIIINMGENSHVGIKIKDKIEVYGSQKNNYGTQQNHTHIATLIAEQINANFSICSIQTLKPRAIINRGDLIILHQNDLRNKTNKIKLNILSGEHSSNLQGIYGANVYFNNTWIGSSNNMGVVLVDPSQLKGNGVLKVIKYGYKEAIKEINIKSTANLNIILQRSQAFLRIDSKPQGAKVLLDGKQVGTTPLAAPIKTTAGFIKLELVGTKNYKKYSTILDLDEGSFDLTGTNAIELEQDYIKQAETLLKQKKFLQAIKVLKSIPNNHSDWLLSQHKLGELYINEFKQPQKALEFFRNVTSNPSVKNFNDKRFIGSFVNEAICLFLIAESLKNNDKNTAQQYYIQAIQSFENIWSQLRFIPSTQYNMALHTTAYYNTLSKHRLWSLTKNKTYLNLAKKGWINYLNNISIANKDDNPQINTLINNAKVYYNQLKADLNKN